MKLAIGVAVACALILFIGRHWHNRLQSDQDATQQTIDKIRNKRR